MIAVDLKNALRTVERHGLAPLARIHAAMPKSYFGPAYGRWVLRRRESEQQIVDALREAGAVIASDREPVRIRFAGISASSTEGLRGALRNWKTAAEKRLKGGSR